MGFRKALKKNVTMDFRKCRHPAHFYNGLGKISMSAQQLNNSYSNHLIFFDNNVNYPYLIQALARNLPHPLLPRQFHFPRQQQLQHTFQGTLLQFLHVHPPQNPKNLPNEKHYHQIFN